MKAFENYRIEKVGDERLEERIRQAYIRKTSLEDYIQELTSEGEGGVGKEYERHCNATEDFYLLLELRERRAEDDKPADIADIREKIKKHILAIREDLKKAGFDTRYISMASFEEPENEKNSAFINNSLFADPTAQFECFYNFTEEET